MIKILPIICGLSLFIYGINIMSEGLKAAAGDKLKTLIELLTKNKVMGILVGAVLTIATQSSTATTIMAIGFVNADIMTLSAAAAVILGANMGTIVTAQLISFDLINFAIIGLFIGVVLYLVFKKKSAKNLAETLIGFSLLFVGMDIMSKGVGALTESPLLANVLSNLTNPYIAFVVGILMTLVLQSSAASVGVLQALASQSLINLNLAFPVLFGNNVGSSIATMAASIGTNRNGKRAGLINVLINVLGAAIFLFILRYPVQNLVLKWSHSDVQRQIANAHTLFNIITVLILIPFSGLLVKLVKKLIPDSKETENKFEYIDEKILNTPSLALDQVLKEINRMAELTKENLFNSSLAFKEKNKKLIDQIIQKEKTVDKLESDIAVYLLSLSKESLNEEQYIQLNSYMKVISDIEVIGDLSENIAMLSDRAMKNNLSFSKDLIIEFDEMYKKALQSFEKVLEALNEVDYKKAKEVISLEKEIDLIFYNYQNNFLKRLNAEETSPHSGIIFSDILSNLERVGDYSEKIAENILETAEAKKPKKIQSKKSK